MQARRTDTDTLTNLEATILAILEQRQGRENAIGRASLVEAINIDQPLFPVSERTIRATIKHLVTQHGAAIGSNHSGYFMAVTAQEIEAVCKYYDSYGLSSLFVSARLRKIEMRDYLGQLSMKFGG